MPAAQKRECWTRPLAPFLHVCVLSMHFVCARTLQTAGDNGVRAAHRLCVAVHLGAGELGDRLGALRHGVLGQLAGQHQAHG
eukprot:153727-Pelagomonas_calceolata.AAC.1